MTALADRPAPTDLPADRPADRPTDRPADLLVDVPAAPAPGAPRRRVAIAWGWVAAVLTGQALILLDLDVPIVRPVLGAALLVGVPTAVVGRRLAARLRDPLPALLYALGLTTAALIVGGLALNTVLPRLGVPSPLGRPVLVAVSTVLDLALVARRGSLAAPAPAARRAVRAALRVRTDPAVGLGVGAVVLSVAGAVRLNNGLGGQVAVAAHVAAVAAVGAALLPRTGARATVAALYLASLALLFGTSLRGWSITGHDIQQEYLAYLDTARHAHWVMSAYPTPYNACLSINILPTVLTQYLGTTGVFTFKVVMQLLFAVVPLCVYALARNILPRRMAVLSAAAFVFFSTFFTDMPFLVRQEVAYLFVALALLATTQRSWSVRRRQAATFMFGVGVVLSHYSTTYVLIITLVLGMAGVGAGSAVQAWRARRVRAWQARVRHARDAGPTRRRAPLVLLGPLVVVALSLTAWTWSTPVTHSAGHLADVATEITDSLIHGNATAGSSDLKYSPFGSSGPTQQQRFSTYLSDAAQARSADDPTAYVFPDPTGAVADPPLATATQVPLTGLGRALQDVGIPVATGNGLLRALMAALFELFLGVGLIALMLHARRTRGVGREQFWLMLGSVGALGAVVAVPGISADYGVLRAFQQTLLFAAPLVAIGAVTSLARLGRAALPAAAGTMLLIGLVLTGAQPALVGGYSAQLTQSNSGQYYDLLYTDSAEIAADQWLAAATTGAPATVAASDIVTVTRLQMFVPPTTTVTGDFLPTQLRRGDYLFLNRQTVQRGQATVFYTGDLLTYTYPTAAVSAALDLVYSSDGTEIYR